MGKVVPNPPKVHTFSYTRQFHGETPIVKITGILSMGTIRRNDA